MFERRKIKNPWEGRMEPFQIAGNVYYVGCFQYSSHLIDTGEGLILIDTGCFDGLYLLVNSIYRLGFDVKDIRYILHSHWHGDHTEATPALVDLSGAKTFIGQKDKKNAERYFMPDVLLQDNDLVELGNTSIQCLETPGHTEGTMSFFFTTEHEGKTYRVGMFGGAGANTLVPEAYDYPDCRNGYYHSLERLKKEKVDIFIGNHTWNNNTYQKAEILKATGENQFLDDRIWNTFLDFCKERLDKIIAAEQ